MKVLWCYRCGGGRNFGDQLGPILLRHYGIEVEWAKPAHAELVTVGSILSKIPNGWTGTVLGTGFIQRGMRKDLSSARVLAVRGALTRRAAGLPADTPLGDPGILVTDLHRTDAGRSAEASAGLCAGSGGFRGSGARFRRTGTVIVPHYVDHAMVERYPDATLAAITLPSDELLGLIAGADIVVTSSLHGLIAADALGVPHVLEPHESVTGGMFKFRDYASAFGLPIRANVERLTPRPLMADRQAEIRALMRTLRTGLTNTAP